MSAADETRGREPAAVAVRPITSADLPRVWALVRELAEFERLTDLLTGSEQGLAEALFGTPRRLEGRVAEREGRIVGYALFHETYSSFRTNPRLWLEDLYVESSARGSGAGAALLRAFVAVALERGCHRVEWEVLDWNPARQFYERLGAAVSDEGWHRYALDAEGMRRLAAGRED